MGWGEMERKEMPPDEVIQEEEDMAMEATDATPTVHLIILRSRVATDALQEAAERGLDSDDRRAVAIWNDPSYGSWEVAASRDVNVIVENWHG